jgi:shikimate dehydrogenase
MKLEKLSGETRLYPIIGDPISFVKSPQRLTTKLEELGHNGICVPMLVSEGALESVVRGLDSIPKLMFVVS